MTELLSKAFEQVSKLPKSLQDEVARQLIEDMESENGWQTAFEKTQDELEKLADKAIADYEAGRVQKKGFDEL
jgi:hypothetical protein